MDPEWWTATGTGLVMSMRVTPGSRRSEVIECSTERLRVRVSAPAVDGKANAELIRFLAEAFGVRRSAVTIVKGAHTRDKTVEITGAVSGSWTSIRGRSMP